MTISILNSHDQFQIQKAMHVKNSFAHPMSDVSHRTVPIRIGQPGKKGKRPENYKTRTNELKKEKRILLTPSYMRHGKPVRRIHVPNM